MVDEVHNSVVDLKVKPEFHKYLIGKKRANVKRVNCFICCLYSDLYVNHCEFDCRYEI